MSLQNHNKTAQRDIAGLDGLRALSVIAVILSHAMTWRFVQPISGLWRLELGSLGVSTFFVISGYLISTLLLREYAKTGSIDVTEFWLRRLFRIVPALMIYILLLSLLTIVGQTHIPLSAFVASITFTQDIFPITHWLTGHLWSLGVEQQFYIVYPLLLIYSLHSRNSTGGLILFSIVLVVPLLVRSAVVCGYLAEAHHSILGRMDMLAFGCLTAIFQQRAATGIQVKLLNYALMLAFFTMLAAFSMPLGSIRSIFFDTLSGSSVVLVIFKMAKEPKHWFTRVLSVQILAYIGQISYSVYLWQQVWIYGENYLAVTVWHALAGTVVCSLLSYYYIELPGMIIGKSFLEKWRCRSKC